MVRFMGGSIIMGLGVGESPRSGVMVISILVMGVKPSAPVIHERRTLRSAILDATKLVTGSGGTACECGGRERERGEGGEERERWGRESVKGGMGRETGRIGREGGREVERGREEREGEGREKKEKRVCTAV